MKKIKYIVAGLIAQLTPLAALAASNPEIPQVTLTKETIRTLIENFASYFSGIIGVLGILTLLYAAFLYMTAAGNDETISKAKNVFIWGLIGVATALIAFGIFDMVQSFLTV
ncbi:MAG: hypothetical protein V1845_03910 [bacterium]